MSLKPEVPLRSNSTTFWRTMFILSVRPVTGQCFVGDHCKKILKHKDFLLDVLPGWGLQGKIQRPIWQNAQDFWVLSLRFLDPNEIKGLSILCWELGVWFPRNFPEETIPPKLHFLIGHIPEIAARWETIGLLPEHGLESIHANVNAINRTYCTVRDKKEHMRLVLGNHQQRVATDKAAIQVPPKDIRKCKCGGFYSIRA